MVYIYELVCLKYQVYKNGSKFMVHTYELVWKKISMPKFVFTQHAQTDLNKKSKPKQKTIKSLIYNPQGFKWTINENPPTREFFCDQILVSRPGIEPGTSGLEV